MNKLLMLTTFVSLSTIGLSTAHATDWTPYLSGIQHNCNTQIIHDTLFTEMFVNKKLPSALQGSLVKRTGRINNETASGKVVLQLKNATAFGEPLTQISYTAHDNHATWQFRFGNGNFSKLLPTFYAGEGKYTQKAGTKQFWLLENSLNDDGTFGVVRHQDRPYTDADKWWNGELNLTPYDDENLLYGYQTTKTGFIAGTNHSATELIFDPKTHTISCDGFYE